jgi:hypothetical protein
MQGESLHYTLTLSAFVIFYEGNAKFSGQLFYFGDNKIFYAIGDRNGVACIFLAQKFYILSQTFL